VKVETDVSLNGPPYCVLTPTTYMLRTLKPSGGPCKNLPPDLPPLKKSRETFKISRLQVISLGLEKAANIA